MKHAVIEDASVELLELFDKVSEEAKKEKNAVTPLNKTLYYWTRKPLIVGRAVVLASTLDDINEVRELLCLGKTKRAFNYIPDSDIFKKKLGKNPNEIKLLDPFAGSGNLAFPATELGLDVSCADYNPLAHIIQRAVLEIPQKYGPKLKDKFEEISKKVIEQTKKEIGMFFKPQHLAYLWVWCVRCDSCSQRVPLTNQMWIIKSETTKIGYRFSPTNDKNFKIELIRNMTDEEGKKFTQKRGKGKCIRCGNAIDYKTIIDDISKNKDRELVAIQIRKNNTRDYILPDDSDKKLLNDAEEYFMKNIQMFENENLIPFEKIQPTDSLNHRLWNKGIVNWNEYFSKRQLLVLSTLLKNAKTTCKKLDEDERKYITPYIAFMICRLVDMSGYGVHWNVVGKSVGPENVLALRSPSLSYNHAEINPFEKVRGSLENIIKNISEGILFCSRIENYAKCNLESVTEKSDTKFDLIVTDPPYGDDVIYAEGSEFFYVWLYRMLNDFYPKLPSTVPSKEDFCVSYGRFGDKKNAAIFFEKGLKKSFVSINEKLNDDGLLVVFFAHSSTEAWNQLLKSIQEAKFKVVSSYAIHTESTTNVLARGKTSFMSSIIVVCRKILTPSEIFFEDIGGEIDDKIKNMIKNIPNNKLILLPITDLLIMVYGKVLEACTQHTVLKSYQKDFEPNFETLIKESRSSIMKEIVKKITGKTVNVLGLVMAFYLLTKIFHRGQIASDDAIKIAQTYNVDIKELEKENIVIKDKDVFRLFYLYENEMDYSSDNVDKNNLFQQLSFLCYTLDSRGSDKIHGILGKDNFRVEDLKQIISLLIKNYQLRQNKGESLTQKEQKEFDILKNLGDILGVKVEGTLDAFS